MHTTRGTPFPWLAAVPQCPRDGLSGTELLQVLGTAPAAAPAVSRGWRRCCRMAPKLLSAALFLLGGLPASQQRLVRLELQAGARKEWVILLPC